MRVPRATRCKFECDLVLGIAAIIWLAVIPPSSSTEPPVISVMAYLEVDVYEWKTGTELEIQGIQLNRTTYIIPGDIVGLILVCNASYPLEWEFMHDEVTEF